MIQMKIRENELLEQTTGIDSNILLRQFHSLIQLHIKQTFPYTTKRQGWKWERKGVEEGWSPENQFPEVMICSICLIIYLIISLLCLRYLTWFSSL